MIRRDPKDFSTAAWLADIYVEAKQPAKAYDLLSTLPNNGRLKEVPPVPMGVLCPRQAFA